MLTVVSDKEMKCLFLFGLCIAVVLSAPVNDDDDQDQGPLKYDKPKQIRKTEAIKSKKHNQNRRRLQTLSLKLVDENDAQRNNVDRDDDDNNDDRRNNDDFGALRELVRESYDVDGPQVTPKNAYANDAKNSHLDLLAKELERLSAKYQGKGVLKVAYSPSKTRNTNSRVYDLGSLHFKYVAPPVSPPQHYQTFNNKIFQHYGDREPYHYNGDKHPYHYYSDRYEHPYVSQYKPEFPYAYPSNYVHGYLRDRPDDDDDDDNNNNNNNN